MTKQFTPTTEQVRSGYAIDPEAEYRDPLTNHTARGEREFDRWLAQHDAEIRATGGDEHHTLDELYEYRLLYNALAANEWATHGTYPVVKSWRHSDGEECFGGGWFIVVATLPTGQVSNHYAAEHWDLFAVPAVETPPDYDGHDPAEAARRMRVLLSQPTPTAEPPRIEDLAPGTTFTADVIWRDQEVQRTPWGAKTLDGEAVDLEDIDPSTIRDVTPPTTRREDS